ncbi:MAG: peptide deformylase [Thermoanaerobaculia bacterium]
MALRTILLHPDPALRLRAAEVERFDGELAALVRDLAETMYAAPGVGLAAPQVGVSRRVAVVDVHAGEADSRLHVLVNPRILEAQGKSLETEGCLSIPGFTEKVERPERVRIAARNERGEAFELEAEGLLGRALCHEIDHLDGVLFIDRITGLRRELAKRRLRKLGYGERPR